SHARTHLLPIQSRQGDSACLNPSSSTIGIQLHHNTFHTIAELESTLGAIRDIGEGVKMKSGKL
ncbi:MAG: hypothetical protein ABSH28_13300, partial [Acidobacteriota bacterium]